MPAYFNTRLYYGGVSDTIKAFQFTNARLVSPPMWTTTNSFGYPGTTPSISANGITNGIVWAADDSNPAVLYAYDAGDLHPLYNSNQASGGRDQFGAGNKFVTPMIANGKVYVGTTNGVGVFGILAGNPPPPPAITSPGTASGNAGKPFSYQITATNNPASYSASPLPSGLTLNATSGRISGTPAAPGTTSVTIGATNPSGTGTATLVISTRGKKH
jgi:hypothetical protein